MVPVDQSRRRWLKAGGGQPVSPPRLPWLRSPEAFFEHCTRCGKCVETCPESILVHGDGGYPRIDFSLGGCVFCEDCVRICPEPVFRVERLAAPWALRAEIGGNCFAFQGVECRSCEDACEERAIRFTLRPGGTALPRLDGDRCSGCGACVSVCPQTAIEMTDNPREQLEPTAAAGVERTI